MRNVLTAVVFDVLAIAITDLARTDWERKLAYWLVQCDQTRVGLGCAGFDISEMGWTLQNFDIEKRFVLSVVDAALHKHGWDRLPFRPHEDRVVEALSQLHTLVDEFPRGCPRAC